MPAIHEQPVEFWTPHCLPCLHGMWGNKKCTCNTKHTFAHTHGCNPAPIGQQQTCDTQDTMIVHQILPFVPRPAPQNCLRGLYSTFTKTSCRYTCCIVRCTENGRGAHGGGERSGGAGESEDSGGLGEHGEDCLRKPDRLPGCVILTSNPVIKCAFVGF